MVKLDPIGSTTASSPQNIGSRGAFLTVAAGVTYEGITVAGVDQNVFFNSSHFSPSANPPDFSLFTGSTDFSPTKPTEIFEPGAQKGISIGIQFPTVTKVTPALPDGFSPGGGSFGGYGAGGSW